jgi:hypothetical protein
MDSNQVRVLIGLKPTITIEQQANNINTIKQKWSPRLMYVT